MVYHCSYILEDYIKDSIVCIAGVPGTSGVPTLHAYISAAVI
jgi:hypothetical protein